MSIMETDPVRPRTTMLCCCANILSSILIPSQDLARFCTDGLNQGRKPPPLNQAEEAAAAAAQSNEEEEEGKGQAAPPTTDPPPAWLPADPVTPANFLAYVQTLPFYRGQLRHTETILGRAPHTVPLAAVPILHPSIRAALEQDKGVADLYTHQARAIEAILPPSPASGQVGRDVIVTTATASGKSLCYTVPFLQSCLAAPESTKVL